jgi:phage baseplate assembly protein W
MTSNISNADVKWPDQLPKCVPKVPVTLTKTSFPDVDTTANNIRELALYKWNNSLASGLPSDVVYALWTINNPIWWITNGIESIDDVEFPSGWYSLARRNEIEGTENPKRPLSQAAKDFISQLSSNLHAPCDDSIDEGCKQDLNLVAAFEAQAAKENEAQAISPEILETLKKVINTSPGTKAMPSDYGLNLPDELKAHLRTTPIEEIHRNIEKNRERDLEAHLRLLASKEAEQDMKTMLGDEYLKMSKEELIAIMLRCVTDIVGATEERCRRKVAELEKALNAKTSNLFDFADALEVSLCKGENPLSAVQKVEMYAFVYKRTYDVRALDRLRFAVKVLHVQTGQGDRWAAGMDMASI